ncbi:hypothetical protein SAMN05428971_0449 [Candidatus Pantoea varia]|uniref:DUF5862 domain-containing protein n=1 Tax=Candidatus Pantoea varia TaxID=1881036 RepID=A0A1I4WZQ7_9GAMM|nr:hypothetical protein [Pantoea varia]SFN19348.1 hypothetical protein SAMN05428971_0449 [Pantoea varia]
MREITTYEIQHVSGASLATAFDGAVIGATSYALSAGKWGGLSILNFGIGQAVGVALGLLVGGVGGALYGATHTSEQSENFFNNILANVG